MKKCIILIVGILLTNFCLSQDQSSNNQISKATFIVEVNNEEYILVEGEELKLDSTTVTVRLADYMKFDNESITFRYPSNYSLEYAQDFGFKNWTLNGNNFVVMYFEIDAKAELTDMVDEMVKQFGKKNCKVEKTQIKVGDKNLIGQKINVTLAGQNLTLDFLEIKMSDYKSRFIAFQDLINEDGSSSSESLITLKMIDETIEYKENSK